jgi:Skp family chaperone for outer membrane proteins
MNNTRTAMKNWIIPAAIFVFVGVSCGKNKENTQQKNETPKVESRDLKGMKIAYYESDSLKVYFDYFKKEEAAVTRKQQAFQKELERRQNEYQNFIIRNNDRLRNGMLSENDQMQIQQKAQKMEADLVQYQQNEGAKLEKETMEKLDVITKKIQVFGKEFSELNKIDILLMHGEGGQINFIHESMNVTKEFTAFLNKKQAELEKDLTN